MIRKACVTAVLAASLTGSAWAGDYGPYDVDPTVESELVSYSGSSDLGLNDYFRFSFAAGSSVKIDFLNNPSLNSGALAGMGFKLGVESSPSIFAWDEDWTSYSHTANSLDFGTQYVVNVYSAASLQSDVAGSYSLKFSIDQTAPVPEPETYAMMLAGLGLLGVIGRRRKLKSAA